MQYNVCRLTKNYQEFYMYYHKIKESVRNKNTNKLNKLRQS